MGRDGVIEPVIDWVIVGGRKGGGFKFLSLTTFYSKSSLSLFLPPRGITMALFKVSIASPPDRKKLVAMVDCGDEQWAEVNQEGKDLAVEFYPRRDGKPWIFPLDEALDALNRAKARLT